MKNAFKCKVLITIMAFFVVLQGCNTTLPKQKEEKDLMQPYDAMTSIRSLDNVFDEATYKANIEQSIIHNQTSRLSTTPRVWQQEGPGNIGGRFNCVTTHPTNANIMYAGAAQGGVFRTTDGGNTWQPIFDNLSYLSVGHITVDPNNPSDVWVGTGDVNISGNIFTGNGIYHSNDLGNTWTYAGLSDQKIIAEIAIHPTNSNIIFAATMGNPFLKGSMRGLYKSTDAGANWTQVLYVNDSTGVSTVKIDPNNPNNIYAASFTRMRNYKNTVAEGIGTQIWRSIDAGNTFLPCTTGLPAGEKSRINLCLIDVGVSTHIIASIVEANTYNTQGLYLSTDNGITWSNYNTFGLSGSELGGFGWYFSNIYYYDNYLYYCGVDLWKKEYATANPWQLATPEWWTYEVHADKHWLSQSPDGSLLLATDGGIYKQTLPDTTWYDIENIPVSQAYHVAWSPHNTVSPGTIYCGLQDNGTASGNSSSMNTWQRLYGGDGFKPAFDPINPNLVYFETQYCGLNYTDDFFFNYYDLTAGLVIDSSTRVWNMQYEFDPSDYSTMYCGTNQVYKMEGAPYGFWTPISPIITEPFVTNEKNHIITALAINRFNTTEIWAATGDNHLKKYNAGAWSEMKGTLPNKYFTDIQLSQNRNNVVIVSMQGYRYNDNTPYIFASINGGITWTSISSNLPNIGINDVWIDASNDSLMLIATDNGVYSTQNFGQSWSFVSDNIPPVPCLDVEVDTINKSIIVGTFARSIYSISQDSIFGIQNTIISVEENNYEIQNLIYHNNTLLNPNDFDIAIAIYTSDGKLLYTDKIKAFETISWHTKATGVYLIKIKDSKSDKIQRIANW